MTPRKSAAETDGKNDDRPFVRRGLLEDSELINAFRGTLFLGRKPQKYKKHQTRGDVAKMSDLADGFIAKFKIKTENEISKIADNWEAVVPARFHKKCSPQNVRLGALYVSTLNPSVKQELSFSVRKILENIRALEGCSNIKRIVFI